MLKPYFITIIVTAVALSLSELIIPQSKMKITVKTVFSFVFLLAMIKPFINFDFSVSNLDFTKDKTSQTYMRQGVISDNYEKIIAEKYAERYKAVLKENDLICEKINVDYSDGKIKKIQVYLSNMVIAENNRNINNNVIGDYVAKTLNADRELIVIYV